MFVDGVKTLLENLLERRHQYRSANGKLSPELSQIEVDILCLLLEVENLNFCFNFYLVQVT